MIATSKIISSVLACCVVIAGCHGESFDARQRREAAKRAEHQAKETERRRAILDEIKSSHNADDSWTSARPSWTVDVQELLIRSDRRPIAGIARLSDVRREREQILLILRPGELDLDRMRIEFSLACGQPPRPPSLPDVLYGETLNSWEWPEYAFVARIRVVRRHDLPGRDGDTHRGWLAEGECLALRQIPEAPVPRKPGPGGLK
jgi:hypothetical protein